jgi:beta-N-acetylhexosaminidase
MDLRALGFNCNCVPVLDIPIQGADGIIGDRAFADDPKTVVALGREVASGFLAGGVIPVMKHIPGHGRAMVDTHRALPVVDASRDELSRTDFAPFRELKDLPAAMTAHVVFASIDPTRPATTSPLVIDSVIRGEIGFSGLLISDDMSMQALGGSPRERTEAILSAGCDIALHCNGSITEMLEVASVAPLLAGAAEERFRAALACSGPGTAFDVSEAIVALDQAIAAGA